MAQVYLVLTDGFEEIEALATVDILRRAEVDVKTVSLTGDNRVIGGHQISVISDCLFAEADFTATQMLIIPGGSTAFNEHAGLKRQVVEFVETNKMVAAICAAPMVLGGVGILNGKKATCYPGFEQYLDGAELQNGAAVVVDGQVITGRGPGLTMDFALQLVELMAGNEKRQAVAKDLLLT